MPDGGWEGRFVSRLETLREGDARAALAALRRGLGGHPPYEVYRWLPVGLKPWQEDAALLVAALFAWHPQKGGRGNLGSAFFRIPDRSDSVEKRFAALLNCHGDDLPAHLRQAVSLLKAKEVPVNWLQLLKDLRNWDRQEHWVQRNWAREFWGGKVGEAEGRESEVAAEPVAELSETE